MKLPISKLLLFMCMGVSLSQVQAQKKTSTPSVIILKTEEDGQKLEQAATEKLTRVLSSLESLEALKSVECIAAVSSAQVLALADPGKRSLEQIGDQPPIRVEVFSDPQQTFSSTINKKISRSFKVNSADKLSIDNQFGEVEVQTWSKNEIAVDISLQASAATEATAQAIMDHINIRISEGGNQIAFVTELTPMQIRSNSQKSFQINYVVRMPKGNPLRVSNKYGAVQLPDLDGPVDLTVKYGKFTTGNLSHRQNRIEVQYSGAQCVLGYMRGGDLNVKYSSVHLNGAEAIQATTAYSKVAIDKIEALNIESKYDQPVRIGSAGQISGSGGYSSFEIGSLRESVGMQMKYSKFEVGTIAPNFKKIELNGGYTRIELGFADKSSFNFDLDTQYSSVKMNQDLADFTFREVRNTSATYRGTYGKSSPKGLVNITSKYGPILFTQQ